MTMKLNPADKKRAAPGPGSLLDVVTTIHSQGWMQNADEKTAPVVSLNERISLSALIAYVAHQSGENEFRVERRLSDRFNVPNMTCLPASQFDDAIRYLVDGLETLVVSP